MLQTKTKFLMKHNRYIEGHNLRSGDPRFNSSWRHVPSAPILQISGSTLASVMGLKGCHLKNQLEAILEQAVS